MSVVFALGVVIKGGYDRVETILRNVLYYAYFLVPWTYYFDLYWYCFHGLFIGLNAI